MGALETMERIVRLGGEPHHAPHIRVLRTRFEALTGAFTAEDAWFEERIRAFWCDAVTRGRLGTEVATELDLADENDVASLERAHRGLFRADGRLLVDVVSGAEFQLTRVDDETREELSAASPQLFDGRVVAGAASPAVIELLPGSVFHSCDVTTAIERVLLAADERGMKADDTLDALLRMGRARHALPYAKASFAYRPEALAAPTTATSARRAQRMIP
jgi:hypothetical protein